MVMNSRQRRVIERHWRFKAELSDDVTLEEYMDVREWCEKKFGKIGYRWSNTLNYINFYFRHDKDFTMFALRWL